MSTTSGYDEQQKIIRNKINSELEILPDIFTKYTESLYNAHKTSSTIHATLVTLSSCFRTIYQDYYLFDETFYEKITSKEIAYYFDAKCDLSIKSLQRNWSILNSFFNFLLDNNYISESPMASIRRPIDRNTDRKLRYLNRNELDQLLMTVKHNSTRFTAFRDEIIIKIAISTGLDISDMVNLNFDHIDFINGTMRVINKKGERIIPLGNSIISLLKKWVQFRNQYFKGSDTSALFVSSQKHRLSVDAVSHMLAKYCEQANVPIISFKDLKSTMVYLLAKENVSMHDIMKFLGVTDYLIVVQAYDAAMIERNINIHDTINDLFDKSEYGDSDIKDICLTITRSDIITYSQVVRLPITSQTSTNKLKICISYL